MMDIRRSFILEDCLRLDEINVMSVVNMYTKKQVDTIVAKIVKTLSS